MRRNSYGSRGNKHDLPTARRYKKGRRWGNATASGTRREETIPHNELRAWYIARDVAFLCAVEIALAIGAYQIIWNSPRKGFFPANLIVGGGIGLLFMLLVMAAYRMVERWGQQSDPARNLRLKWDRWITGGIFFVVCIMGSLFKGGHWQVGIFLGTLCLGVQAAGIPRRPLQNVSKATTDDTGTK